MTGVQTCALPISRHKEKSTPSSRNSRPGTSWFGILPKKTLMGTVANTNAAHKIGRVPFPIIMLAIRKKTRNAIICINAMLVRATSGVSTPEILNAVAR